MNFAESVFFLYFYFFFIFEELQKKKRQPSVFYILNIKIEKKAAKKRVYKKVEGDNFIFKMTREREREGERKFFFFP